MIDQAEQRFVILTHDHPFLHWDLMLEEGDALTTFRLLAEPAPGIVMGAEALPPHRKAYLDYEGPVSGGRGTVKRWDQGSYRVVSSATDQQVVQLTGNRLDAVLTLRRDDGKWTCVLSPP